MIYQIPVLTEKIDEIADKYIRKDELQNPKGDMGFLRKHGIWPREEFGVASWKLLFEEPPDFESTNIVSFQYCFNPSLSKTKPQEGFYLHQEYLGNNSEEALSALDTCLSSIPQKD